MGIIETESQIDILRNSIPDNKDLDEAKRLICQAQNIIQKHIERVYPANQWLHCKTVMPSCSSYNLEPEATTEEQYAAIS